MFYPAVRVLNYSDINTLLCLAYMFSSSYRNVMHEKFNGTQTMNDIASSLVAMQRFYWNTNTKIQNPKEEFELKRIFHIFENLVPTFKYYLSGNYSLRIIVDSMDSTTLNIYFGNGGAELEIKSKDKRVFISVNKKGDRIKQISNSETIDKHIAFLIMLFQTSRKVEFDCRDLKEENKPIALTSGAWISLIDHLEFAVNHRN